MLCGAVLLCPPLSWFTRLTKFKTWKALTWGRTDHFAVGVAFPPRCRIWFSQLHPVTFSRKKHFSFCDLELSPMTLTCLTYIGPRWTAVGNISVKNHWNRQLSCEQTQIYTQQTCLLFTSFYIFEQSIAYKTTSINLNSYKQWCLFTKLRNKNQKNLKLEF